MSHRPLLQCWSEVFFFKILPKCIFGIGMYAYFIHLLQGSAEMHLRCGGVYNNHIIADCLRSVPVKEFWKWSIIGEDMDRSKVARFLAHAVDQLLCCAVSSWGWHCCTYVTVANRQLSDVNRDGALSLDEFCTAMHLVVLRRNDIELPDSLPPVLQPYTPLVSSGFCF